MPHINGDRTSDLTSVSLIDDLVGNREGTTVRITSEALITLISARLGPAKKLRSELFADLNWNDGAVGSVFGDTDQYNGVYVKSDASGQGGWARIGDLPVSSATIAMLAEKADVSALLAERDLRIAGDSNSSDLIANLANGDIIPVGGWDASSGAFPTSATTGNIFRVTVAGTVDGISFAKNDTLIALANISGATTYAGNWLKGDYSEILLSAMVQDFETVAELTTTSFITLGQIAQIGDTQYKIVTAGTYTANGVTVINLTGISGQAVSRSKNFADLDTFFADETIGYDPISMVNTPVIGAIFEAGGHRFSFAGSAATDHHIQTFGGAKFYAMPDVGFVLHVRQFGVNFGTTTDQLAKMQLAVDTAIANNYDLDWGNDYIRMDGTLLRAGSVKRHIFHDSKAYFPATGIYVKHRLDDDSADAADGRHIFLDMGGYGARYDGTLTIEGVLGITNWKYANRSGVLSTGCGVGGHLLPVADVTWYGALIITGVAEPIYVPANETGLTSRQFARFEGFIYARHCLTPIGSFGGGSNGLDDSVLRLRSSRCGGYGAVIASIVKKTTLNAASFFWKGLIADDAEDGTVDVTSGSRVLDFTNAPSKPVAGDYIVVDFAYTRAKDSVVIPLCTKVESVAGDFVTVVDATASYPNLNATGLTWWRQPPAINFNAGARLKCDHIYPEGKVRGMFFADATGFLSGDFKGGGTDLSGLQGCLVQTTGMTSIIKAALENTIMSSNGIEAVFGFGMLRNNPSGGTTVDSSSNMTIDLHLRDDQITEVIPVMGIEPIDFFASEIVSRYGYIVDDVNVTLNYANKRIEGEFAADGTYGVGVGGVGWSGGKITDGVFRLPLDVETGSNGVAITTNPTTATTIFSGLPINSYFIVNAYTSSGASHGGCRVITDASGNVTPVGQPADATVAFTGSAGNLQATTTSGTRTVIYTIVNGSR